jgi:CRISPR-associated protein Csb3
MTGLTIGSHPLRLLTHLALYGLAAICEDAGHRDLRLSWTPGMNTRPHLDITASADEVARLVQAHAQNRAWVQETIPVAGTPRGLMSPRLSGITTTGQWQTLQAARHHVLDILTASRSTLDLALIGALGEPCYWRYNLAGKRLQDDATSRLEMQPRNTGAEFVGTRLSKVATAVASRSLSHIRDGILGTRVRDEAGNDAADSRTATGLDAPGPADNALVWCALWGISQTTLTHRTPQQSVTSICLRSNRQEHFYIPVWQGPWHPARLRTIIASQQLRTTAKALLTPSSDPEGQELESRQWLAARGVTAIVTFPINIFGSGNAPERRAGQGTLHPIASRP